MKQKVSQYLADYLAQYNDLVFGNPMAYSGGETLVARLNNKKEDNQ